MLSLIDRVERNWPENNLIQRGISMASWMLLSMVVLVFASCSDSNNTSESTVSKELFAASSNEKAMKQDLFRVMPLGDSITQADSNHNSFRRPLWQRLEAAGFEVDFVGSQQHHHRGNAPNEDFDLDHEGHWGWRADEILNKIERWAIAHQPDAVLIHLGSNDIFQGQSNQSTVDELAKIVFLLRRVNREVVILVAQIIPTSSKRVNREIRKLNDAIALLGLRLDSPQSPVRVVDQYSGFTALEDTYDGVHPNEQGEAKMAVQWQGMLVEYFERRGTELGIVHLPME